MARVLEGVGGCRLVPVGGGGCRWVAVCDEGVYMSEDAIPSDLNVPSTMRA